MVRNIYIYITTGCPPLNPSLQPEYVTNNIHTDNVKGSYSSTIFPRGNINFMHYNETLYIIFC